MWAYDPLLLKVLSRAERNCTSRAEGNPRTYEQAFYARDLAVTVVLVGVPSPDMKIELALLEVFGRGGSLRQREQVRPCGPGPTHRGIQP